MYLHECVVARGYGRISGRTRVLKQVAESREATLGYLDHLVDVEPAERAQHDTTNEENSRDGRSSEVWRRGDPRDEPPPENPVRRV
jgi:hypothetical protein